MSKPDDIVGPGRPPKAHRFNPGQSGNPAGRPRRKKTESELAAEALKLKVPVTIDGRTVHITLLEAAIKQAMQRRTAPDVKLVEKLLQLQNAARLDQAEEVQDEAKGCLMLCRAPKTAQDWEQTYGFWAGGEGPDGVRSRDLFRQAHDTRRTLAEVIEKRGLTL